MESVGLGRSDLSVSRVGLGCNNFGGRVDRGGTRRVVDSALDVGITFFDTAESYGGGDSERFLGAALGERRPQVVLATKFGWAPGELPGGAPERVRRSIDGSLGRLGTDVVDLYYYHRPDGVTPLAETLGAMHELVDKYRRGEPAPAGSRLSDGRLSDDQFDDVERLAGRAEGAGHTLLELAIGGLAAIDGIASVIAGATTPEQVRANAAAGAWRPTSAELESLLA